MSFGKDIDHTKDSIKNSIRNKKNTAELASNIKYKQLENEVERKQRDEDKIELMTQFMLDPTSSATKLLEKRREMYELQEALSKDKEKFNEKETQFKKTEEELRNRDEDFHKKICEYYQSTYEKKQTDAQENKQRIENELTDTYKMERAIKELIVKNENLKKDLDKLKNIHDKLRAYEEFLKKVKDKHPESFTDLNGVIEKYKILETKYKEISDETERAKKFKEDEKINFRLKKSELESRINELISTIQTTQEELKLLKEEKKNLENEVTLMEANSNTVVSSLEMVLLGVDNIFKKCKYNGAWTNHGQLKDYGYYDKNNPDKRKLYQIRVQEAKEQIKHINDYIQDYTKISDEYHKMKKNSNK